MNEWRIWGRELAGKVLESVNLSLGGSPIEMPSIVIRQRDIPMREILTGNENNQRSLSIAILDLGPRLRLVGISAEPVSEYLRSLEGLSPGRYVIPAGCMGDVFGYLPAEEMISQGGCEAGGFLPSFSLAGHFRPTAFERVNDALRGLLSHPAGRSGFLYTARALRESLSRMGIRKGDTLLVRAALKAMGPVEGRTAPALIEALLDAVGPSGTIFGLAFNPVRDLLMKRGVRNDEIARPLTPPSSGGLASALLERPGAIRSIHPTNSWVGIGRLAGDVLAPHDEKSTCFGPVRNLLEHGGKMLLVGCTDSSPGFSTVHFAQEILGLATQSLMANLQGTYYEKQGQILLFRRKDVPGCSMGFSHFYPHYIRAGALSIGWVGDAFSMLIEARRAFDIEMTLLKENPKIALCDDKKCFSCRGTRLYNLADMPKFYSYYMPYMLRRAFSRRTVA